MNFRTRKDGHVYPVRAKGVVAIDWFRKKKAEKPMLSDEEMARVAQDIESIDTPEYSEELMNLPEGGSLAPPRGHEGEYWEVPSTVGPQIYFRDPNLAEEYYLSTLPQDYHEQTEGAGEQRLVLIETMLTEFPELRQPVREFLELES